MNKIFIISGPSGCGKGTIVEGLLEKPELKLVWTKSYTTRKKRESDKDENHYIFVTETEFKDLEKSGEIIESNLYNDNWYGSSKKEIDNTIDSNKNVIKDVDVNGGVFYKKTFNNSVLIFIKSDLKCIEQRLISRGQNTEDEIKDRMKIAEEEMSYEKEYNYSVENPEGNPGQAIDEIAEIIQDEIKG